MTAPNQNNLLLAKLPPDEMELLRPHLKRVRLAHSQPLIVPDKPIPNVYFPIDALASLVTVMEDGRIVEAGCVGCEGMVGIPVLLGTGTTRMQTIIQIAGEGYMAKADAILSVLQRRGAFHDMMQRYLHTLFVIASQSAACNRLHSLDQRLSRWLLMSSDGIRSQRLALTQEYLAGMLGVRRAGVTEAALKLQDDGLIRYTRGNIEITDRNGLEQRACECYAAVKQEYERLLS